MDATFIVVLVTGAALAAANGANDLSKGVASLAGAGVTSYRTALFWGTGWSLIGGLAAGLVGGEMVSTFSQAFISSPQSPSAFYGVAILLGATAWVVLATMMSLPVSTTHALVGAGLGVVTAVHGAEGVPWNVVGGKVALPLLVSPGAALVLAAGCRAWNRSPENGPAGEAECLCVGVTHSMAATAGGSVQCAVALGLEADVRPLRECNERRSMALRLDLDRLHWLGSGLVSFARAANDVPKMGALVIGAAALSGSTGTPRLSVFLALTVAMVLGGLFGGRRVTKVLAEDITDLDHRRGVTASLVTAALVSIGATLGLPMSTTHVSASAIAGAGEGETRRNAQRQVIRRVVAAWAVTVPGAALLGMACLWLVSMIGSWWLAWTR